MTTITRDQQDAIQVAFDRRLKRELVDSLRQTVTELLRGLDHLSAEPDDTAFDEGFLEMHAAVGALNEIVKKGLEPVTPPEPEHDEPRAA
jgi:hypothetical protein